MWNRYSRPPVLGDTVDVLTRALDKWPHHVYAETYRAWTTVARTGPWSVTVYTFDAVRDGQAGQALVARHHGRTVLTIPNPSPALVVDQLIVARVPVPAEAVTR